MKDEMEEGCYNQAFVSSLVVLGSGLFFPVGGADNFFAIGT